MATEILRPNGAGVYSNNQNTDLEDKTNNYLYVDETTANDLDFVAPWVYGGTDPPNNKTWYVDTYTIQAHSIPEGSTINKVTFYGRFKEASNLDYAMLYYRSANGNYQSSVLNLTSSWAQFSWEQTKNQRYNAAWTRDDITNLQIGVALYYDFTNLKEKTMGQCSQLWIVVDYTEAAPEPPTNVAASENNSSKVVVTWTKSDYATGYKIYRDGDLVDTVGDVATYDDTGADAPVITPGSAIASDGTSAAHVALSLSGNSIANGTTHTYKVKATNEAGDSDFSDTDTGYRLAGSIEYQWQRSSADADADYSNIDGATTAAYDDTGAPANPQKGNVTRANMKISAIDGTAFVDFSTASVLTDYVGGKLTVTDSAGKKLIGYIKAAGTGETLGSEKIGGSWTNGGTSYYPYNTLTTSGADVTSAVNSYGKQVQLGIETATYSLHALYKVLVTLTLNSGEKPRFGIGTANNLDMAAAQSFSANNGANTAYITTRISWALGAHGFYNTTLTNWSATGISFKQVLTPSATGVTIVSTKGGSTYNWASKDVDFNYYDASGYTYKIIDNGRYYKCLLSASDSVSQYSAVDRGYRNFVSGNSNFFLLMG